MRETATPNRRSSSSHGRASHGRATRDTSRYRTIARGQRECITPRGGAEWIDCPSADDNAQAWVLGGFDQFRRGEARPRGACRQSPPRRFHLRGRGEWPARSRVSPALRGIHIRMQDQRCIAVGEHPPIAGVEVAFRRQRLGQQDVMRFKFDMVIRHGMTLIVARDAGTVHQPPRQNQRIVEQHGMIRGHQQIAAWHPIGDRSGADQNRPHLLRCRMAGQIQMAGADPPYRPLGTGVGNYEVSDAQILDRDRAARRQDPRAQAVTWRDMDRAGAGIAGEGAVVDGPGQRPDRVRATAGWIAVGGSKPVPETDSSAV